MMCRYSCPVTLNIKESKIPPKNKNAQETTHHNEKLLTWMEEVHYKFVLPRVAWTIRCYKVCPSCQTKTACKPKHTYTINLITIQIIFIHTSLFYLFCLISLFFLFLLAMECWCFLFSRSINPLFYFEKLTISLPIDSASNRKK